MTTPHPRPQLTRAHWMDLCGTWAFAYDDDDVGLDEGWFQPDAARAFPRTIQVPFPPESPASGVHDRSFHPVVWYARTLDLTRPTDGERVLLQFGAVDYRASVWVNGQLVAQHQGGHTPFTADITAALNSDGVSTVVVRAEDDPQDLAQPRGKQDWQPEPHAIWYHRTTGIWQPVWLERVPHTHLQALRWTPDLDRTELRLHARLNRTPRPGVRLRVRLSLRGATLADVTLDALGRDVRVTLPLHFTSMYPERHDLLWSPTHPNLIDAHLTLLDGDAPLDEVGSYAGMRSAEVRAGQFLLNGAPLFLRMVLAQNYWPDTHLAAPSPDALRQEAQLVKDLGFNGVRIHQKVEDPRFLYWCDQLGLLVWGEMANAYAFTEDAQTRLTAEWTEAVTRDYNHPSLIAWVPLNESWGLPNLERDPAQRAYVRALYHLTRALDPTRPVIANDGWQFITGDVLGIHDYALSGHALRERYGTHEALQRSLSSVQPYFRRLLLDGHIRDGEAVMLTEFGGISLQPAEGEQWWGYGTVQDSAALLGKYEELLSAILASDVLMGFCYTQLTDTEQESNGLVTAARIPKVEPSALRAINTRPARSVPGEELLVIHHAAHDALVERTSRTTLE
ncbi:glycoside hydrolase family 2 protein [Deinococcus maricopensis]|uniref:Beta-galactosidase n=1 Tax=Deinococcus maricopensis (strain DSM 21211 / LMG 22137 / NRRL B-23946 / LB-34) TaxID=709986 RepID=E8U315_DEIML|nr:glycoside hydrolase family 2 [Deinococcus maricopensis]ADV65753.1 Beta-galactosidase [Deinococcus maricopensis DSM 21211]